MSSPVNSGSNATLPLPPLPPTEVDTPLSALAPDQPDPTRPYWCLQSSPLEMWEVARGQRLPARADYWCHESDPHWRRVERTDANPRPRKEKKKPVRKKRKSAAGPALTDSEPETPIGARNMPD